MYLSTAPYLSFAGAHLPRLKVPVPLHLLVGRPVAFATFRFLARHAPWTLREPAHENSFIKLARQGADQAGRSAREGARRHACGARSPRPACAIVREELHVTGTIRRLPAALARCDARTARWSQDVFISNMEYVLARRHSSDRRGSGG